MVRAVGRPPERDSEGNVVSKCLVNVTIPTKLRDFLSKNKVNRSKLFKEVVTRMYKREICPKCYRENIINGIMVISCEDCGCKIEYNSCDKCGELYEKGQSNPIFDIIESNLPIAIKGSSEFGCQRCQQ